MLRLQLSGCIQSTYTRSNGDVSVTLDTGHNIIVPAEHRRELISGDRVALDVVISEVIEVNGRSLAA